MDPVKRKVISELFFAPSVVLPIVAGISAGLLSWATGGGSFALNTAALVGILGGLGWMATRVIFKVEQITEQVLQLQARQAAAAEDRQLDQLGRELRTDGDPRTQDYLTLLRSLRGDFRLSSDQPGVRHRSSQLRQQVDDIFHATVTQLRETLRLARLAENLTSEARRTVLRDRETLMIEIRQTIEQLKVTIGEFQTVVAGDQRADLTTLRQELEASMRSAKRTEERIRELDSKTSSFDADDSESTERP